MARAILRSLLSREPSRTGALSLDKVSVSFGGISALDGVSLCVWPKEIVGLIGPNGAGKTTVLNVISGYVDPRSGSMMVGQVKINGRSPRSISRLGIARTFQSSRLFDRMTALENVEVAALSMYFRRSRAKEWAHEMLRQMSVEHRASDLCSTIPLGERNRVGMARALALRPRFLLLDEPASGHNNEELEMLRATVSSLPETAGCGVLLVEHNMDLVMSISSRVHVLAGGSSLTEGVPAAIMRDQHVRNVYLGSAPGSVLS